MTTHTPGPWHRGYGNFVYQGAERDNQKRIIAVCEPTTKTQEDWCETFANARLIASAPALLKALENSANTLEALMAHIEHKPEKFKQHCWQQVLEARAAIDKAVGNPD